MLVLSFWLKLAVTTVVGLIALLHAASAAGEAASTIWFLIFLAAIAYGFWQIKSAFDRIDRGRH
ncbi:MAG: hypothetical protein ACREFJ_01260 [Acetobacteraceae bacterium]